MSDQPTSLRDGHGRYRRVPSAASGPDRRVGGFYRSSDGDAGPRRVIGRPLASTEDAVIAAVRLAYDVADAQVDRSLRIASRLKAAGDTATGTDSDRLALQSLERLALRAGESALAWIELSAAEPGSPLRRVLAAEYRWLGRLFGLTDQAPAATAGSPTSGNVQAAPVPTGGTEATPPRDPAVLPMMRSEVPRPVRVSLQAQSDLGSEPLRCVFSVPGEKPVPALLRFDARRQAWVLELPDLTAHSSATWTAAACADDGVQVAIVKLELL
ncbi:hypothetical protein [Ideonella sp. A 288]|uniref:hypothetical protein n=1 Tax=Ideonella sp. A 288 TaxID=1962181 RepID=UPI000B4B5968|nr:hypothetical protein [Ideonella sp. A 288]